MLSINVNAKGNTVCIVGRIGVETCFLSMLGLRAILYVLLGQYKGRNMLSINVRAKGNTVRIVRPLEG